MKCKSYYAVLEQNSLDKVVMIIYTIRIATNERQIHVIIYRYQKKKKRKTK